MLQVAIYFSGYADTQEGTYLPNQGFELGIELGIELGFELGIRARILVRLSLLRKIFLSS